MESLDLRLVRYFVAVAEELHFGRAAARLHIAQPSLSHQIRRLEQQLGVTLLTRTSRQVQLTEAGRVLLTGGRRLLTQAERVAEEARAAAGPRLRVGFQGSAATEWLPRILQTFADAHPDVTVSVCDLALGRLDTALGADVDVVLTRLVPGQSDAEIEILGSEPRLAVLPSAHRLAGRDSLAYRELDEEAFIINPVVAGPVPPLRWLREQARHGLPGRVAAQASSLGELLTLVAAGAGVSLVPASVAAHHPRRDVVYVPVTDAEPAVISLAWPRGAPASSVGGFVDAARQTFAAR